MTEAQQEKLEEIDKSIEFAQREIADYMKFLKNLQDEKEEILKKSILKEILEEEYVKKD